MAHLYYFSGKGKAISDVKMAHHTDGWEASEVVGLDFLQPVVNNISLGRAYLKIYYLLRVAENGIASRGVI